MGKERIRFVKGLSDEVYFTLQGRTNFKWEFQIGTTVFIGTSLLKQRTVLVSTFRRVLG